MSEEFRFKSVRDKIKPERIIGGDIIVYRTPENSFDGNGLKYPFMDEILMWNDPWRVSDEKLLPIKTISLLNEFKRRHP